MTRKTSPVNRAALLRWYSFRGKVMPLWREWKRLADELSAREPSLTPERIADRIVMEVRVSPLTAKQRAARARAKARRADAWQRTLSSPTDAHGRATRVLDATDARRA